MSMYTYRADGMRVQSWIYNMQTGNQGWKRYFYDGQMGFEDKDTTTPTTVVTDYALGARGVDGMSVKKNGGSAVLSYPLYDAHGNMVMTISRSGTNNYAPAMQERSFDAWGNMRMGTAGDPAGRYCASLGHKQDDESGLIYMRARYYEPTSGRFISEDPGQDGSNWFTYVHNKPTTFADMSGRMLFDLGISICDRMKMAASQASVLAAALSRCGDKIAQTCAAWNFRLSILTEEAMDDCEITITPSGLGARDTLDVLDGTNLSPSDFQKIMAVFNGSDPQTGNDFLIRIHWLQETNGTQVFDVKLKSFIEK